MSTLYRITTRRTFSADDRWKPGVVEESDYLSFNPPPKITFEERDYTDEIAEVEPLSDEEYTIRRKQAQQHYSHLACCDQAVLRNCVCSVSFLCPVHGVSCHGTHD